MEREMHMSLAATVGWQELGAAWQERLLGERTGEIEGCCLVRKESAAWDIALAAPADSRQVTIDAQAFLFAYRERIYEAGVVEAIGLEGLIGRVEPDVLGELTARWGIWSNGIVLSVRMNEQTWLPRGWMLVPGAWVRPPTLLAQPGRCEHPLAWALNAIDARLDEAPAGTEPPR
jgi:hypothetical protein